MPVYFGTGDGRPALLLLPLKVMVPAISRLLPTRPRGASHGSISGRAPGLMYSLLMMGWAAAVAAEKRIKLRAAHRGASRGLVVIADRYPQNENADYNDGPLLPRLTRAPRWLRQLEAQAYSFARNPAPYRAQAGGDPGNRGAPRTEHGPGGDPAAHQSRARSDVFRGPDRVRGCRAAAR